MPPMKRTNPYWMGRNHATNGLPSFHHRKGKHYDSSKKTSSYQSGYSDGCKGRTQN
jgi:hypothetical protein